MGYRGAVVALVALTLSGCATSAADDRCTVVPSTVTNAVREGVEGDLVVYDTGRAVQAGSGVWYVAYDVEALGEDEVAVFAVGALDGDAAPIMAVSGYASSFTSWPVLDGANGSPDASAAVRCLSDR